MQKNHFSLLKKLKNTTSAQLCCLVESNLLLVKNYMNHLIWLLKIKN